jgi:predicted lipid-binding transport protein (Tim44 family)
MIREVAGAAAAPFDEVWNLSKPMQGNTGWVVAGIQQLN